MHACKPRRHSEHIYKATPGALTACTMVWAMGKALGCARVTQGRWGSFGAAWERSQEGFGTSDCAKSLFHGVNFTMFGREFWCVVGMLCGVWVVRGVLGYH